MSRFWWVNHKQTVRQEIDGHYLWSPKTRRDGARNIFYDNMRAAEPGDIVLSYANQKIAFVGRVAAFAITASKPEEFGVAGANWRDEGWLLPVFWTPLDPPVRPKLLIERLRRHLPKRYSPINPATGHGNQGAYLAAIPDAVFDIVVAKTDFDRARLAHGGANSLDDQAIAERLDDLAEQRIRADPDLADTTRESVIQARRGQGKFRANVEAIERRCRLTEISNPSLLIASHIKPWRLCASAHERLDGMNGLLLTPDADLLFDRGFISFEDEGDVLVSPRVDRHDLNRLGFQELTRERFGFDEAPAVWRTDAFAPPQCGYLAYHREAVFIG